MIQGMPALTKCHNGKKGWLPFSDAEMERRENNLRSYMATNHIDAALLTSYHNVCYYSGFLYRQFGRKFGLVIDSKTATTITPVVDGGEPWRRSFGDNITYTDWNRENFFRAVQALTKGVKRLGVELDDISSSHRKELEGALPGVQLIDIGADTMWMRIKKSAEELKHMRECARICNVGAKAGIEALVAGVPEYEVALASDSAMIREIAKSFPSAELMGTWTWFQSGINSDGAHNPVTSRKVQEGDLLSLLCFPMVAGYCAGLERTLFYGHVSDAHLDYWRKNCEIMRIGSTLIKPGRRCSEIADELNDVYRSQDLLKYRSCGYGHSFGVFSHYYGREAGLELREDVSTIIEPGMVLSLDPMITIPDGEPGAGGYREHDMFIITPDGAENITNFPYGPERMVLGAKG